MKRITDPAFRYVPACATDIRKTFKRLKREQRRKATQAQATAVVPMRKSKG